MEQRPQVGIAAIVIKDGKVLMHQRKNAHGDGTWSFPGGHLEFGESWEGCAKREAMEEAGIELTNVRFATITNDIFEKEGKHYITIFVRADLESGEPKVMEPDKCVRWEWVEWGKMPQPVFKPIENLFKAGFRPS
jgi:8-oxo-dGTP diphosphatase